MTTDNTPQRIPIGERKSDHAECDRLLTRAHYVLSTMALRQKHKPVKGLTLPVSNHRRTWATPDDLAIEIADHLRYRKEHP